MPTLEALKRRHPEHIQFCEYWELLTAVVEGGDSMTDDMKRKLLPNPDGRPEGVMKERTRLATYCNKISPILSRFNSELFKNPAVPTGSTDPFWSNEFFKNGALLEGDDDGRASFNTFLMNSMFMALTTGKAIAQIDTKSAVGAVSLAHQKESGELNPYVILHPRTAMWDWKSGREGFSFCKLHQFQLAQQTWDSAPIPQHTFTVFYRLADGAVFTSKYIVKKIPKDNKPVPPQSFIDTVDRKEITIETVIEDAPIFNVRGKFEFPIVTLTLPKSLWMAAQLFDCQKSYFNQTAAAEYALYTSNYSMPIITGVDDEDDDPLQNRKMGDGYYLTLKTGQSITSFERSGGNIQTAISYRSEIKRDIYDVLQQIAMSASDGAAIIARSGVSKAEDRRPEEILLERYGQCVKEFVLQILEPAAIAHGEIVDWEITGYDEFLGFSLTELLQDMQLMDVAAIPSPTFKKEIQKHFVKRAARSYDLDAIAIEKALGEISNNKTAENTGFISSD
jgi:hypothetical protein